MKETDSHHRIVALQEAIFNFNFGEMTPKATMVSREIEVYIDQYISIKGDLIIPEQCDALVIFSHGSGSSRFSIRNRHVAGHLNKQHFATLLMDLLTPDEDQEYQKRFDIDLLTERLATVTAYIHSLPELSHCTIGYFGASTGAASALKAAAKLGDLIGAVVSRGGRPDLAMGSLAEVRAPVLLIVGSLDTDVIILNRKALALLSCEKKIIIVDGASHLFEERGKLDEVAILAADWFRGYLQQKNI